MSKFVLLFVGSNGQFRTPSTQNSKRKYLCSLGSARARVRAHTHITHTKHAHDTRTHVHTQREIVFIGTRTVSNAIQLICHLAYHTYLQTKKSRCPEYFLSHLSKPTRMNTANMIYTQSPLSSHKSVRQTVECGRGF